MPISPAVKVKMRIQRLPLWECRSRRTGINREEGVRTFYCTPINVKTHEPINCGLPVINDRFSGFAEALGWSLSPGQQFAPLRSIVTGPPARIAQKEHAHD